ncbi:CBL-interacting serine/threonine-protein kinase 9-like [Populus alba x Populus x berolinensis]|uniref:non-specific serine/threonine protein kinase n=1 Tax=Populus alba x Populus x berolinensis TaxID=444605 RepID=A0AAD6LSN4_9ROSI|nr:CBL-interacting serine/threonine-protein kinase 9-like [Populus alba x Populus x berolinensis]
MSAKVQGTRTRVGKYELGKTIGEGSFAKVKVAKNVETGDVVAIKILDREQVLRHKMVEQLKREISTMKLIKHPNVIKIFEVMASKTKIYIVIEFVDGGELFDKIAKHGRLREDEARRYFQQLINAVDYCHSRGVFHRDLKICSADFRFPSWFSSGAKKLIKRILDPEPLTRITVAEIIEDEWFKKGYKPPQFEQEEHVNVDDVDAVFNDSQEHLVTEKKKKPASMNAFELISKTQGFSLENLFGKQAGVVKRETRIASHSPANEIMSRIEEAAKPLGFNVDKRNYKMKLKGDKGGRKGQLSVATEVFEVAPSLHMVELRKIGGDTLEFHNFYKSFSSGLKDVVWKSDQTIEGLRS